MPYYVFLRLVKAYSPYFLPFPGIFLRADERPDGRTVYKHFAVINSPCRAVIPERCAPFKQRLHRANITKLAPKSLFSQIYILWVTSNMGVESRIRPYYLYHWHGTGTGTTPLFLKGLAWSVWWFNFVMMKFKRLNLYSIYIAVENYSVKFVYCQVHTHTVDRLGELDFKTGLDGTHFYFIVMQQHVLLTLRTTIAIVNWYYWLLVFLVITY